MTTPEPNAMAELDLALARSVVDLLRTNVEALAYAWAEQAKDLDPEYPWYDETIADSIEESNNKGHASGLRQAAQDALAAVGRGLICNKCDKRIIDPASCADDGSQLCIECGDPS